MEVRELRARLQNRRSIEARLIGHSPQMERVRHLVADLGSSAADVLIHGETGTGKELAARCLHDASSRHNGNFVALNCGGLPESLLDSEIFGHEAGAALSEHPLVDRIAFTGSDVGGSRTCVDVTPPMMAPWSCSRVTRSCSSRVNRATVDRSVPPRAVGGAR